MSWYRNTFLSLSDQATIACSSFLVTLLLARVLPISDFGIYSVLAAANILIDNICSSLLTDTLPATLRRFPRGSGKRAEKAVIVNAFLAGLVGAAVVLLVGAMLNVLGNPYSLPCFAIATGMPGQRVHGTIRRIAYVRNSVKTSFLLSFAQGVVALGAIYGITHAGIISPALSFLALAVSFTLPSLAYLLFARRAFSVRTGWRLNRYAAARSWEYGRWLVAASVALWLGGSGSVALTAAVVNTEAAGVFRALLTVMAPPQQIGIAAQSLLIAHLARGNIRGGQFESTAAVGVAALLFSTVLVFYCIPIIGFGGTVLKILFKNDAIVTAAPLLIPISVYVTIESYRLCLSAPLMAMGNTKPIFTARVLAVLTYFPATFLLGHFFQLIGIATAMVLSSFIAFIALVPAASRVLVPSRVQVLPKVWR